MNENQTDVILEEVRNMFKVLAEGQQIMQKDIQDLKEGQVRLEQRVDRLEKDVKIIKSYVEAIDDGMNDHERRITALEKKTSNL